MEIHALNTIYLKFQQNFEDSRWDPIGGASFKNIPSCYSIKCCRFDKHYSIIVFSFNRQFSSSSTISKNFEKLEKSNAKTSSDLTPSTFTKDSDKYHGNQGHFYLQKT